jgi:3-oxoacyl-(acyl-carrier-protein) synthase
MSYRVVITGIGPLTAIGTGKDALWQSVEAGRSNVTVHQAEVSGEQWTTFPLAKVPHFDIADFGFSSANLSQLQAGSLRYSDEDLLYLIATIQLALADSDVSYDTDENDIALVLTHEAPGVDRHVQEVYQTAFQLIADASVRPHPSSLIPHQTADWLYTRHREGVYNMQSFMYLHHVSKVFGLHGYALFINNACASGLYAIEAAAQQIQSGRSKIAIVAGAAHPVFPTTYFWFRDLGMYAEDGVMQPFDKNRHGFVLGDGGCAFVLEEWEQARRRGATVYAEYLGGGFTQDAWKVTVPHVAGDFYTKAFEQALRVSGVAPNEIDLVNPHGVATPLGDRYEARTLTRIFGEFPTRPLITAFKPYVGHDLGGCALTELAILLAALQNDLVPATLNLTAPDETLKLRLVDEPIATPLRTVAKMACGFAGYNAVGIFRKVD